MPDLTPGDLRVTLRALPHRTFVRDGDHLYTKMALSLKEVGPRSGPCRRPAAAVLTSLAWGVAGPGAGSHNDAPRRCWASGVN